MSKRKVKTLAQVFSEELQNAGPLTKSDGTEPFVKPKRKVHPNTLKNLKPFKKGQSGNPNGRPKGSSISAVLREILDEKVQTPHGKIKVREMLARVLIREARRGVFPPMKEILDRTEGPVRQEHSVSVERQVKIIEGVPEDAL